MNIYWTGVVLQNRSRFNLHLEKQSRYSAAIQAVPFCLLTVVTHSSISPPPFASSSVFITQRIWISAICLTPLLLVVFQPNNPEKSGMQMGRHVFVWRGRGWRWENKIMITREKCRVDNMHEDVNACVCVCLCVQLCIISLLLQLSANTTYCRWVVWSCRLFSVVPQWQLVVVYRNYMISLFTNVWARRWRCMTRHWWGL